MAQHKVQRPTGVTIIAILTIIGGILLCFGGLALLILGAFFSTVPISSIISEEQLQNEAELEALVQFLAGIGIVIGGVVLTVGIGYLVVSYGQLKGKGWAWTITIILTIIAIVTQVISVISSSLFNVSFDGDIDVLVSGIVSHIIGIAISGVILYYLFRPSVKAYFGKSQPSTRIQR